MKSFYVILAVVALATSQKVHKSGKHAKTAYSAASPGTGSSQGGQYSSSNQSPAPYNGQGSSSNYQGGGGGHNLGSPSYSSAGNQKSYPLLLADTRTLNTDGTINFNFQADNGLQQGESVDADGTRRGFYSYPGADGKPITVKYTAGKNGFIAEGDHLPRQPQSSPHSDKDESYSPKLRQGRQESYDDGQDDGEYRNPEGYDDGQYRPGTYSNNNGGGGGQYSRPISHKPTGSHYSGAPASKPSSNSGGSGAYSSPYSGGNFGGGNGVSFVGFGDSGSSGFSHGSAAPQTYNHYAGTPSHGGGRPQAGGAGRYPGGGGGSSSSFSSLSDPGFGGSSGPSYNSGPSPSYNSRAPSPAAYSSGPSSHSGAYSADNPYQSHGAGPVNANFDLGNSGHFSINFNPGSGQEYQPGGGDFGGGSGVSHNGGGSQSYAGSSGPSAGAGGSRGQY